MTTTLPAIADSLRSARLRLTSSINFARAENGATAAEIAHDLSPEDRASLPAIAQDLRRDLLPIRDSAQAEEDLSIELTKAITLVRGGWTSHQREDWVLVAVSVLSDLPLRLTLSAIGSAQRECRHEGDIVPTVRKLVEKRLDMLERHAKIFDRMAEAVGEAA